MHQVPTFPHLSVGLASMSQSQSQLSILALLAKLYLGLSNFQQQAHLYAPHGSTRWCSKSRPSWPLTAASGPCSSQHASARHDIKTALHKQCCILLLAYLSASV